MHAEERRVPLVRRNGRKKGLPVHIAGIVDIDRITVLHVGAVRHINQRCVLLAEAGDALFDLLLGHGGIIRLIFHAAIIYTHGAPAHAIRFLSAALSAAGQQKSRTQQQNAGGCQRYVPGPL